MIISHRLKCIFVKTKKTAGTSFEVAFSKFLGPQDIITPISGDDEYLRRELFGVGAQNFCKPFLKYTLTDVGRILIHKKKVFQYYNHIPASLIKERIGEDVFNSYYKSTIERNPWDKVVSRFFWEKKQQLSNSGQIEDDFESYVRGGKPFTKDFGYEMYSINGIFAMDECIKYDEMELGIARISEKLGLDENIYSVMKNIDAKGGIRPNKKEFRSYYSEDTKNLVAIACAREIAKFGFTFDS